MPELVDFVPTVVQCQGVDDRTPMYEAPALKLVQQAIDSGKNLRLQVTGSLRYCIVRITAFMDIGSNDFTFCCLDGGGEPLSARVNRSGTRFSKHTGQCVPCQCF